MLLSCDPEYGYNLCAVAGNSLGRTASEESRKKMSLSRRGRKFSEEHKLKLSNSLKGKNAGEKNPNFGKFGPDSVQWGRKHSPEALRKISVRSSGANNPRAIPVFQFSLSGEFIKAWGCGQDAARALGMPSANNIYSCCKNRPGCKSAGGFIK